MATVRSLNISDGTLSETTYVNSTKRKPYTRAPRGTKKRAVLNEAFKQSCGELAKANPYSQNLKASLDPIKGDIKSGELWNKLNSRFRRELKFNPANILKGLEDLQVSNDYSLQRLISFTTTVLFDTSRPKELLVSILYPVPTFPGLPEIDGYQLTVAVLYAGDDQMIHFTDSFVAPITALKPKNQNNDLTVHLKIPDKFKTILLCVKCEGTIKGGASQNQRAKGMQIVKVMQREEIPVGVKAFI